MPKTLQDKILAVEQEFDEKFVDYFDGVDSFIEQNPTLNKEDYKRVKGEPEEIKSFLRLSLTKLMEEFADELIPERKDKLPAYSPELDTTDYILGYNQAISELVARKNTLLKKK